jgi:S-formylglutathione hydrolase FrmB
MQNQNQMSRRQLLKGFGGAAGLAALGGLGFSLPKSAQAASNGFGLTITEQGISDRLQFYRFSTSNIAWQPAINVVVPNDYYHATWRRYPVMYLLHGGAQDFRKFHMEDDILGLTNGRPVIVVMPDGGTAGWYCNPVRSFAGNKNWESFHMNQLIPWIDANFRTYAEYDGRAVSGFSMGGFGALKYTAKYYGHFCSVSSHSGPASLRRDQNAVLHWANQSSKWAELNGGTLYGEPFFDQGRVTADNPVERLNSYTNKRIFLVCGLDQDVNETFVRNGQREFRGLLASRGIPHEWYELPGAHFVRRDMLQRDVDGVVARCRKA